MTYFDDPNEKFVAAKFSRQTEDGRQILGVRMVVTILPEEIEPYKKNTGFKGNTYYTTDVKRTELFNRLERDYGYKREIIGYDSIQLINQTKLDEYIAHRKRILTEVEQELTHLNAL